MRFFALLRMTGEDNVCHPLQDRVTSWYSR